MVDYGIARAKYLDAFVEAVKWSEVFNSSTLQLIDSPFSFYLAPSTWPASHLSPGKGSGPARQR